MGSTFHGRTCPMVAGFSASQCRYLGRAWKWGFKVKGSHTYLCFPLRSRWSTAIHHSSGWRGRHPRLHLRPHTGGKTPSTEHHLEDAKSRGSRSPGSQLLWEDEPVAGTGQSLLGPDAAVPRGNPERKRVPATQGRARPGRGLLLLLHHL